MTQVSPTTSEGADDSLQEAISRNVAVVISLPTVGTTLTPQRTRFLGTGDGGIWIESLSGKQSAIDHAIENRVLVGIAFKSGVNKILFTTHIWRRQPGYQVNEQLKVEALLLAYPASLKSVQRRAAYRVSVPAGSLLSMTVWRIAEQTPLQDTPASTMVWPMRIHDLSIGGMGASCVCPEGHQPHHFDGQRLRIQLSYEQHQIVLEGRVNHIRQGEGANPLRVGVKFNDMEGDMEGRQSLSKLTTIVGQLHRTEVRRLRSGLSH